MPIEINNNTVVRIIVRSGTDASRQLATLAQGELGYTVDTRRLFVGDGINTGGNVIGNNFLGIVSDRNMLTPTAQIGDTAFETLTNALYALTASGTWGIISPGLYNLEYSPGGIRVAPSAIGTGLYLNYLSGGTIGLDSTFWALSTVNYGGLGSLYLGNILNNTWANSINSRLVVDGPVYSNGITSQIQLRNDTIAFNNSPSTPYALSYLSAASAFVVNTLGTSLSTSPGVTFTGGAVRINNNLYVDGNIGLTGVINSTVHTTLGLSTLSADTTGYDSLTALILRNESATINPAVLASVTNNTSDIFYINTRPFVGINVKDNALYSAYNAVIGSNTVALGLAVSGCLTVSQDISANGDIIAFSSSDATLKQNINPISNALTKLLNINGVEFDWLPNSIYSGHDVGVIAQDVEKIIPSAVRTRYDGYKGVMYDKLIPLIIEAIRELKNER